MPIDDDKVFDVSRPHKVSPSATSRPIIVGHHPMMNDPMVKEAPAAAPADHLEHHHVPVTSADNDVSPTLAPALTQQTPDPAASYIATPPEPAIPVAHTTENPEPGQMATVRNDGLPPAEPAFTPVDSLPSNDAVGQAVPAFAPHPNNEHLNEHMADNSPLVLPIGHGHHRPKRRKSLWLLLLLTIVAGAYLAIDARLIKTSINLPFHIFSQPLPVATTPTPVQTSTPAVTDPYADWIAYSSSLGKFSFKYPNTWVLPNDASDCPASIILLGANTQSVGDCHSGDTGQMGVVYETGDKRSEFTLTDKTYKDIVVTPVTVDGVVGQKETGTVTDAEVEGKPVGTKVTGYTFYNNAITYGFAYAQLDNAPDALSDFDLMVTKTLTFN